MFDEDQYISINEKKINVLLSLHPDDMLITRNGLEFVLSIKG